jgi:hypothetical protein
VSHVEVLTLAQAFAGEADPFFAGQIAGQLGLLQWLFPVIAPLGTHVLHSFLRRIGLEAVPQEPPEARTTRVTLLRNLAVAGGEVGAFVFELWRRWKADHASVDIGLVPLLLGVGVAKDGAFEEVLAMSAADPVLSLRQAAILAIGQAAGDSLERVLDLVWEAPVKDMSWILLGAASNSGGPERMWEFVTDNWEWIEGGLGSFSFLLPTVVAYGTMGMASKANLESLGKLLERTKSVVGQRALRQAQLRIESDAALIARDQKDVAEFIAGLSDMTSG